MGFKLGFRFACIVQISLNASKACNASESYGKNGGCDFYMRLSDVTEF